MNTESTPPPPFRGFPAAVRARHRLLFGLAVVAVASLGIVLFADFLWRTDLYGLKWALLVVYAILFTHLSFGFCTALFGFGALRFGAHPATRLAEDLPAEGAISEGASTAILVPIYNEDVTAVFGNLRATYRSLEEAGVLEHFDFFVLSDTRDPEVWLEEEAAWKELCRERSAFDRIHYRHRRDNARKKAGNISHFLEAWGAQYRYMIIFDADSLMLGSTLASLVRTMEANPQVGILQTVPGLYRGETLYAR
ncbi:MAG: glycosyltransferase, partial [Opitutales bacterium]